MKELQDQILRFVPEEKTANEDRLVMLCDGIFAIAITLLVIGIGITPRSSSPGDVTEALSQLIVPATFYLVTFLVIAVYWRFHRRLMQVVQRLDNGFISLTFFFLVFIVFFPVVSKLLGDYGDVPAVVALYTLSLSGCGFAAFALWVYATWNHRLVSPDMPRDIIRAQTVGLLLNPLIYCASLLLLFVFVDRPYFVCFSWLLIGFTQKAGQSIYKHWPRKVAHTPPSANHQAAPAPVRPAEEIAESQHAGEGEQA